MSPYLSDGLQNQQKIATSTEYAPTPEHLHARYAPRIGRHIRAVMGPDDEHEDIAQEVLITVLRKIGTVRDPACVDAWVAQVTANHLRLVMRQRRLRRQTFCTLSEERQHPSVLTNVEGREIVSRAMRAMERLPSTDRILLTAHWFTPGTAETIATNSDRSVFTMRRRLSRARARFEKIARRDPALAQCLERSRRHRDHAQSRD